MALNLSDRKAFWAGRRVLITGNSGFKGAWLQGMLDQLGAEVFGLSLQDRPTFKLNPFISNDESVETYWGDIRNQEFVYEVIRKVNPAVVFHFAAQPIVSEGFSDPVLTYDTNIMGTINVLNACRAAKDRVSFFNVTSDKCYSNRESGEFFHEDSPLGGIDPYSASKACAEIVGKSLAHVLEKDQILNLYLSGRAGNVFGGGDFGDQRLIPDLVKSLVDGTPIQLRAPDSIRPWQFVLGALDGYLVAIEKHLIDQSLPRLDSYNFGPASQGRLTVSELIGLICKFTDVKVAYEMDKSIIDEAQFLNLDTTKAQSVLGWKPKLSLLESLEWTFDWYRTWIQKDHARIKTLAVEQIQEYLERQTDD